MLTGISLPAVIVDLETTGGNVTRDKITEIGMVLIDADGSVSEWSSLINPACHIPYGIQQLTGISNEMVANAPSFDEIAPVIWQKMQGRLFIAHHVRFDYGFLKNAFARLSLNLTNPLLCTVRLSRSLFPEEKSHSLENIIRRYQIYTEQRHRALADAKATYQFLLVAEEMCGAVALKAAQSAQGRRASLPPALSMAVVDKLPQAPGVYYFWGEHGALLYVGKSINVRKRVLSHFYADASSSREMQMCQQVYDITADETGGELGALLLESQQIKRLQPLYNRRLRKQKQLYSIVLEERDQLLVPQIIAANQWAADKKCYGLYVAKTKVNEALRDVSETHQLCLQALGVERSMNRPCSAYQFKCCRGWCAGKESDLQHNVRLVEALTDKALVAWPYQSAVVIEEKSANKKEYIVVHNWCVLGRFASPAAVHRAELLPVEFDRDVYRYLARYLFNPRNTKSIKPLPAR